MKNHLFRIYSNLKFTAFRGKLGSHESVLSARESSRVGETAPSAPTETVRDAHWEPWPNNMVENRTMPAWFLGVKGMCVPNGWGVRAIFEYLWMTYTLKNTCLESGSRESIPFVEESPILELIMFITFWLPKNLKMTKETELNGAAFNGV